MTTCGARWFTVLLLGVHLSCRLCSSSSCQDILKSISPTANEKWIDADSGVCTKTRCRLNYTDCLGSPGFPKPFGTQQGPPQTEDMVLVFSDEFNSRWRDFGPGKDARWQALDLLYVNDDAAVFRQSAVRVRGGSAIITASKTTSNGPFSAPWGDQPASAPYTSGMLQGWNKFCFTGGYLEARIKLPGDDQHGGLWPAVFTLGNLGRAGYMRSTNGLWPWSYDTCDSNALNKKKWTDHDGQRINRCNSTKGRGASEIDLLEVGVWESSKPELSTSFQVAPVLPLGVHWLDQPGGVFYPTYGTELHSAPNGWAGINSYMEDFGNGTSRFRPRPGSKLADAMSATHRLNSSFFNEFFVYGFDWKPRKYIRWYINDILIYELNQNALAAVTNGNNESVGERLIPVDPQYININVAMSNSFAAIDPNLPLPAEMLVDYIRVYQQKDEINVGCDTPDFPSQAYIDAHLSDYKINLAGWDDFVGNSSVMGPTMQAPPPDYTVVIVAVTVSVTVTCVLRVVLGIWLWRRWRRRAEAEAAAARDPEAAERWRREEEERRQREEALGRRRWWVRVWLLIWRGSPGLLPRHALAPRPNVVQVVPLPQSSDGPQQQQPQSGKQLLVHPEVQRRQQSQQQAGQLHLPGQMQGQGQGQGQGREEDGLAPEPLPSVDPLEQKKQVLERQKMQLEQQLQQLQRLQQLHQAQQQPQPQLLQQAPQPPDSSVQRPSAPGVVGGQGQTPAALPTRGSTPSRTPPRTPPRTPQRRPAAQEHEGEDEERQRQQREQQRRQREEAEVREQQQQRLQELRRLQHQQQQQQQPEGGGAGAGAGAGVVQGMPRPRTPLSPSTDQPLSPPALPPQSPSRSPSLQPQHQQRQQQPRQLSPQPEKSEEEGDLELLEEIPLLDAAAALSPEEQLQRLLQQQQQLQQELRQLEDEEVEGDVGLQGRALQPPQR